MTGSDDIIERAIERRSALLERCAREETDCVRLFHGIAEGRPGLTIDRYGPVLLVQTWREPLADGELDTIARGVERALGVALVPCWNHRGRGRTTRGTILGSPRPSGTSSARAST